MHLARLTTNGFRNLSGEVEFSPGLNILAGRNAQGKTNILEAIYLLANTKSFRTNSLREVVTFGETEAILAGTIIRGGIERDARVRVAGARKELYLNGKRTHVVEYLSNLDAIAFTFDDLGVVRGEPAERRRFLDRGIVGLRPAYLRTLAAFNRTLKQKNALLRAARDGDSPAHTADDRPRDAVGDSPAHLRSSLEAWNSQLVALGTTIHEERIRYVDLIAAALERNLFGESLSIRYRSSFEGKGDLSDYSTLFAERLKLRFDAEIAAGHALIGPQRDDLDVAVNTHEAGRFGSAGQQRSALLILDLAQVSVYYDAFEEYPILLIDDIDAELDRERIERLLGYVDGRAQTFVSTSKPDIADSFRSRAEIFSVSSGSAVRNERQ